MDTLTHVLSGALAARGGAAAGEPAPLRHGACRDGPADRWRPYRLTRRGVAVTMAVTGRGE